MTVTKALHSVAKSQRGLASRVALWVFVSLMLIGLLFGATNFFINRQVHYLGSQVDAANLRNESIQASSQTFYEAALDARGYIAYGQTSMLDDFRAQMDMFHKQMRLLQQSESTPGSEMQEMHTTLNLTNTYEQLVQQSFAKKEKGQVVELLPRQGGLAVNQVIGALHSLSEDNQAQISDLLNREQRLLDIWLFWPFVVLLLTAFVGWTLVRYLRRHIVEPVTHLESVVRLFGNGIRTDLMLVSRSDEIGSLADGVSHMITDLEQKQQEAIDANLELQEQRDLLEAQNEEIMAQQTEQTETLNRLERQQSLIERILESSHEGMAMCDAKGRVIFSNPQFHESFGVVPLLHSDLGQMLEQLRGAIRTTGKPLHEEVRAFLDGDAEHATSLYEWTNLQGEVRSFELYGNYAPIDSEHAETGYLFVVRDRTEEQRAEQLKDEFISIVSHELRTPLAAILGFVDVLMSRELPLERRAKYLKTIQTEGNRLANLINDFLDLQRMEAGKLTYNLEPLDFAGLVPAICTQWTGNDSHQVQVSTPAHPVFVLGDSDRLTQVIHNLVSNAIKYSPGADEVQVSLVVEECHAILRVKDFGLGIPEDAKDKLFTKFYRVDNSDRRQIGGSGLGLAIAREIAEEHQGELTFDSVFGEGSIFSLKLPLYEEDSAHPAAEGREHYG